MLKLKRHLPDFSSCAPLALALGLGLGTLSAAATASPVPDYPFVHVTGSAFRPVIADIAALDFEIVAVDADPAAARAAIEARVGEIHVLMDHLSIDRDDATIREVRQNIRKDEKSAAGGPVYELRCDVHINVRNLTNWPALAGGLLGKPNLSSFAATFDISNMEQVSGELVNEAILDARRRAEIIAQAGGRRLGAMMGATPNQIKNLSTSMGLERDEFRVERRARDDRRTDVDREELMSIQAIKLRQPVDVLFRLENPLPGKARPGRQ